MLSKVQCAIVGTLLTAGLAGISTVTVLSVKHAGHSKQDNGVTTSIDDSKWKPWPWMDTDKNSTNTIPKSNKKSDEDIPHVKFDDAYMQPSIKNQIRVLLNNSAKDIFDQKSVADIKNMWRKQILEEGMTKILGHQLEPRYINYLQRKFERQLKIYGNDINRIKSGAKEIMDSMSKQYTKVFSNFKKDEK